MRETYWRDGIERRQQSGLTVAEFCGLEGVSTASYYNWRKRLREQEASAAPFVPVSVTSTQPGCLGIVLTGGEVIRVPDRTAIETISDALQALAGVATC